MGGFDAGALKQLYDRRCAAGKPMEGRTLRGRT